MKRFIHTHLLLLIVFITGAAVLVIEVAATRILSVYFGNTIFTVSSVLSVVLLALSLGYFIGGRLADKKASELLFFQIIALSGLSVFLLQLLNIYLIPEISSSLSLQHGPLVASTLLFLLPGFLLGMLSPLVAKLQNVRLAQVGIGQITGDVFFWSTLGSIVGSLLTGFYLIPSFGVNQIIVGTGVLLLLMGLLGIVMSHKTSFTKLHVILFLLAVPVIHMSFIWMSDNKMGNGIVFAADGLYDNITIYDGIYDGKRARFLQQSTDASSAMYLDSPELVYPYTKYYETYKLIKPDIKTALVIGGGAYSVPKALLQADSDVVVDVAEIEPEMFEISKRYFLVPDDPRLVNHVEDGRRFLAYSQKQYDVIFVDAFHTSIPSHLTTEEFFQLSKSKLAPDGVFIMNAIGSLRDIKPSFLLSELKTFRSVYNNNHVFAVYSPSYDMTQNVMLVGYNTEKRIDPGMWSQNVVNHAPFDLSSHPTFTDNYAPVEYFITKHQE